MNDVPEHFTYVLLGRDHPKHKCMGYSADLIVHRLRYKDRIATYAEIGYVVDNGYYWKEIDLGYVELEWDYFIDTLIDKFMTDDISTRMTAFVINEDFCHRLKQLKKASTAKKRFEDAVAKHIKPVF